MPAQYLWHFGHYNRSLLLLPGNSNMADQTGSSNNSGTKIDNVEIQKANAFRHYFKGFRTRLSQREHFRPRTISADFRNYQSGLPDGLTTCVRQCVQLFSGKFQIRIKHNFGRSVGQTVKRGECLC